MQLELASVVENRSCNSALPTIGAGNADFFTVVDAVSRALRLYPYFIVLTGLPAGRDQRAVDALMKALSGTPPDGAMDFTVVRVQPEEAECSKTGTRFSRTHLALPPHTDSTSLEHPHSIVAFQMVRSDGRGGGRSTVVPVQDLVDSLGEEAVRALRDVRVRFGEGKLLPVLWDSGGSSSMRYYRAQIEWTTADQGEEIGPVAPLFDRLDALLETLAERREFELSDGEVLLLNNHKALHGRTSMSADSERLMYRFRTDLPDSPGFFQ